MIMLGLTAAEKQQAISDFLKERDLSKCVILSPKKWSFDSVWETIDWPEIIRYRIFYRLLREIDANTLVVVNECLRTQKRPDLTYNCIRHFLALTSHSLVFQWFPMIDSIDDAMILVDFDTKTKWKGSGWKTIGADARKHFAGVRRNIDFIPIEIAISPETIRRYDDLRGKMFRDIGSKDPHTIPRNLHLVSGKEKAVARNEPVVGRNNRFGLPQMVCYKEQTSIGDRTVFEFAHNFIDMIDFLSQSQQARVPALVTELKVDQWYLARYQQWAGRLADAYSAIFG